MNMLKDLFELYDKYFLWDGCVFTLAIAKNVILNTFSKGEKTHPSGGLLCMIDLNV